VSARVLAPEPGPRQEGGIASGRVFLIIAPGTFSCCACDRMFPGFRQVGGWVAGPRHLERDLVAVPSSYVTFT
jgi:hypothetical protein